MYGKNRYMIELITILNNKIIFSIFEKYKLPSSFESFVCLNRSGIDISFIGPIKNHPKFTTDKASRYISSSAEVPN
jgi:hydrogenase maturation factor